MNIGVLPHCQFNQLQACCGVPGDLRCQTGPGPGYYPSHLLDKQFQVNTAALSPSLCRSLSLSIALSSLWQLAHEEAPGIEDAAEAACQQLHVLLLLMHSG